MIVASGARYRKLDVDGLADFECKGVYYAATAMEARECAQSPVVIVGGGNSAGQAAVFLGDRAPGHPLCRGPDLKRACLGISSTGSRLTNGSACE